MTLFAFIFSFLFSRPAAALPAFGHVVIVVEENREYDEVVGNAAAPFINDLASHFGLATQYFANTHPSIGNYFMMTVGSTVTNNDAYAADVPDDNIVRQLLAAGKTWRAYAEALPGAGYVGGDVYPYSQHHNPLSYFTDVRGSGAQSGNVLPFSRFAQDLSAHALPAYAFVIPDLLDDAHDGSLASADAWLKANLGPYLASPEFHQNGLLIVVFDEGSSNAGGGGRVVWTAASPYAKAAFQSVTTYEHASTLRLSAEGLGLASFPNASATAPNMAEFFNAGADAVAPTAPSGLSASAALPHSLLFSWTAGTDNLYVTDYRLEVSTDPGFGAAATFVAPVATSIRATGLTPATSYYARVRAEDAAGNLSAATPALSAATPPEPADLARARVYPNPLRRSSGQSVTFAHLPPGAAVRVYTVGGALVKSLGADADGQAVWDGNAGSGARLAHGLYFVSIVAGGDKKTLKLVIEP